MYSINLSVSSTVTDESNDETNVPHKPFLTNTQLQGLLKLS